MSHCRCCPILSRTSPTLVIARSRRRRGNPGAVLCIHHNRCGGRNPQALDCFTAFAMTRGWLGAGRWSAAQGRGDEERVAPHLVIARSRQATWQSMNCPLFSPQPVRCAQEAGSRLTPSPSATATAAIILNVARREILECLTRLLRAPNCIRGTDSEFLRWCHLSSTQTELIIFPGSCYCHLCFGACGGINGVRHQVAGLI